MSAWSWIAAARTHVGHLRSQNEDALLVSPERGLFVVADGMGGHAAGEVASALAAETLDRELPEGAGDEAALAEAVREANRRIRAEARRESARSGMGTTLTALALRPDGRWLAAQVGDSRAYRLRSGALEQLTRDHSWVRDQVEAGRLEPERARGHAMSGVLTRALGTEAAVEVDTYAGELREADLFVLATDGLTDLVPDARMEEILREAPTAAGSAAGPDDGVDAGGPDGASATGLETAAGTLVREALAAGGRDNVTVVLVLARRGRQTPA